MVQAASRPLPRKCKGRCGKEIDYVILMCKWVMKAVCRMIDSKNPPVIPIPPVAIDPPPNMARPAVVKTKFNYFFLN
jgi:hypothetical protein